jgi:phosphate transport system protein
LTIHLQRDLQELRKELLLLGTMVETTINQAIVSLNSRRPELADKVLANGDLIDEKEVFIEESCLKILALHQPVAIDLRFIVVALKVNNDLERMGDFAENIAERAKFLSSQESIPLPSDFSNIMSQQLRDMIRMALDSLVNLDVAQARQVMKMDKVVDDINRNMYGELQKLMMADSSTVERAIHYLSSSRYMERIGDLATNIAEDVIFMVEGRVVRHQKL